MEDIGLSQMTTSDLTDVHITFIQSIDTIFGHLKKDPIQYKPYVFNVSGSKIYI